MRLTIILSLFIAITFAIPLKAFAQAPVEGDHSLGRQVALELCPVIGLPRNSPAPAKTFQP